ncbi:tyrosine-type recombinase/integrase [Fodinicurvata sp. EGI_FJ10296]|uniref:tyrosine-type recombinase/integrase n=1 Tax=Fodinicurvata sp. EGI_FJ10296 TaxID=3231908 RepID=UPI0034533450
MRTPRIGPVLTFNGKPIKSVKKSFATACRNARLIALTNDNDENGNAIYTVDVSPHTLRHTCGTWQARKGVLLWEIAGYLGHAMSRTTELYAHHHPE